MEIKNNQPLAYLTTFRIGGPALYLAEVVSVEDLKQALSFAQEKKLNVLVIGAGSNVLISDEGFNGLVIHIQITGLTIADNGMLTIAGGENWDSVVASAVKKNLAGIECLSGVPGSAGGSVVQNIGAYGQTIGDSVREVTAIEVATGNQKVFSPAECGFEYRNSFFKKNPNKYVIVEFKLQLIPGGLPTITYPDVKKQFADKTEASLIAVRDLIIQTRANKGYLIMPGYESFQTAGSFFKNPIVTKEQFERIKPMFGDVNLNRYWETPNGIKLAAAFLMQEAGFTKGYREGNVGISPKHSLSLVNFGGATALEVKTLAEKIKNVVFEKYSVNLEEEILYV